MQAGSDIPTVILLVNGQGGPHSLLFRRLLRLKLTSWIVNIIGYCILAVSVVGAIMFGISFRDAGAGCYAVAVPCMTMLPVCVLVQRLIRAMAVQKDQTTFPSREVLLSIRNRSIAALVVALVAMVLITPFLTGIAPFLFRGYGDSDDPDFISTGVMLALMLIYIYIPATCCFYITSVVVNSVLVHSSKRALCLLAGSAVRAPWGETAAAVPAGNEGADQYRSEKVGK